MRNFSPSQQFFAIGQTIQANFHLAKRETVYAWLSYYTPGKFSNDYTAVAKLPTTVPPTKRIKVSGRWLSNEISVGWKHYFKGGYDEPTWSLYTLAGFGLMLAKVENSYEPAVDTSAYVFLGPAPGSNSFKRLTFDLGIGMEYAIGGNFFLYGDIRTWIPTSDYPSPYLHDNRNVPLPITLSAGLRILFDMGY